MCGIVGFVGQRTTDLARGLLDRLATLEYRGYDSAGVVTWDERRGLAAVKAVGGLLRLKDKLPTHSTASGLGLAHTRWATHGTASERNALPISSPDGKAFIVFNGIVENDQSLRRRLAERGLKFSTDNDAETLLLWILQHDDLAAALSEVKGRYAFCLVRADQPDTIFAARQSSPLIIGLSQSGYFLASDVIAIQKDVSHVYYLEDQVIACITPEALVLNHAQGRVQAQFQPTPQVAAATLDARFETFTEQEIYAQPEAIAHSVGLTNLPNSTLKNLIKGIDCVYLVGCGSAFHAASLGESLIQQHAGKLAKAVIASEFRSGYHPLHARTLVVAISQSGETADTLASIELARVRGARTLVIGNVVSSSMARAADVFLPLGCGPEIGVGSTKAYTTMLIQVAFLALTLADQQWHEHQRAAELLPGQIEKILARRSELERMARNLRERKNFLFIGRENFLPSAYEGALKLRELSYRHAEGIGAGELKHGTLALIEASYPVIAIAPKSAASSKMVSSIQEIKARGGQVWGVVTEADHDLKNICHDTIVIPETLPALAPILATIPLQLFAYEFAKTLGRNIDRPRNLAKSVTVE